MTRSIKQNRFFSRAAKRKSDMHGNDPTRADVFCTKNAKSGWNPGQMESGTFFSSSLRLADGLKGGWSLRSFAMSIGRNVDDKTPRPVVVRERLSK
jgi:hypothetical protein